MKQPDYLKVLDMFCGRDEYRPNMVFPWKYQDKLFASNGYVLVLIDNSKTKLTIGFDELDWGLETIKRYDTTQPNCDLDIHICNVPTVKDSNKVVKFNNAYISGAYFNLLKRAAKALREKTIKLVYTKDCCDGVIFQCGVCRIVVMPRDMSDQLSDVEHTFQSQT